MDTVDPLLILIAFGVASGLLWLGAELAGLALARPIPLSIALGVAALALAACGLWWPGHLMPADAATASKGLGSLLSWLPALLLAACAGATGTLIRGRSKLWVLAGVLLTLMASYGHAMLLAPGVFRLSYAAGAFGAGAVLLTLCAALIAAQLPVPVQHGGRVFRLGGVLVAAATAVFGAAVSAGPATPSGAPVWHELLMLTALIGMAAVLRGVLKQPANPEPETTNRPARSSSVDHLTGLPTRLYFEAQLTQAAQRCRGNSRLAVYFIDLDGFKPVNDTFGHSSGDRVLEQVGARLKQIARGAGVAARVGGDEFVLLAPVNGGQEAAAQTAGRVIEQLSRPYRVDERDMTISCSVGIAMFPEGCGADKLIARADAAMYAAKRAGGARHCFYSREMDADVQQNFDMLRDLREALANNQLELFFQPKIDARSGKVTAAEALLRWQHPTRGTVMPGLFIPLAERSGLIGPLGNWVIEAACKQARAWRDKGLRMRVAINLSAYQMRQDDIVDRIADALKRHRIHPSLLTCEITESAAMEDTLATQETFRRLGELGAHLSIDDFGTGYSSLSYLRQLPAEELKIDQSFVRDIESGADARAVVDAVVKLAHALGLKVVAEGVENPRQQQILVELGCDELQGFLFAKPMSPRALLLWAIGDRSESAAFRDSLFGETRQTTREMSRQSLRPAA